MISVPTKCCVAEELVDSLRVEKPNSFMIVVGIVAAVILTVPTNCTVTTGVNVAVPNDA
ncbi:hypothetical protein QFZ54_000957 [Sphingomonas faeni]|nr:hypothetical protein [Sphingomonas faeni]